MLTHISSSIQDSSGVVKELCEGNGPWARHFKKADSREYETLISHLLRLYLHSAFIWFDLECEKYDATNWFWTHLFALICPRLGAIISFNYDLILERSMPAFSNYCLKYIVKNNHFLSKSTIPILKPHGSINFRIADGVFHFEDSDGVNSNRNIYTGNAIITGCNYPIKVVNDPTSFGFVSDIILPNEYSFSTSFQWVKPGYDMLKSMRGRFTECLIVGLSYSEPDQPELNRIFDLLGQNTKFTIVDPRPNPMLKSELSRRFTSKLIYFESVEESYHTLLNS